MSRFDNYWEEKLAELNEQNARHEAMGYALVTVANFISQEAQDTEDERRRLIAMMDDHPNDIGLNESYKRMNYRLSAYQFLMGQIVKMGEN